MNQFKLKMHNGEYMTNEGLYGKRQSQPVFIKERGIVDYVDFSPSKPHNLAVTSSVRIQIYNPTTRNLTSTLCCFQKSAYGGNFVRNGQFVVCGDEDGCIKLFETNYKHNLCSIKAHTAGVHRTYFTDELHIASFSDDRSIRLWDIASEQCVQTFEEQHSGYIRAGYVSPASPDILLSGGYDGKVKMYDTRTNSVVFEVNHQSPVHSVLFLPTGGIFISSGGTHVKVWDAFAGGRLIATMSQHSGDVTCLRLASNGRRLLSGGLDRKIKVYDTFTYTTVHTLNFSSGITSMCMSPNDETLVVGMTDGIVSVQRMDKQMKTLKKRNIPTKQHSTPDKIVVDYEKEAESKYDIEMRNCNYDQALEAVFHTQCTNQTAHTTVVVGRISELMRRKVLDRALTGQSKAFLIKFLSFLKRFIGDHRFLKTLIDVSNCVLDVFENSSSLNNKVASRLIDLGKTLKREDDLLNECLELEGAIEMLMYGAMVAEQSSEIEHGRDLNKLKLLNVKIED